MNEITYVISTSQDEHVNTTIVYILLSNKNVAHFRLDEAKSSARVLLFDTLIPF